MKTPRAFQPHLVPKEIAISDVDWIPRFDGWCIAQIQSGVCYYWRQLSAIREIAAGSTLVFSAEAGVHLRASRIDPVLVRYYLVEPERIGGILTVSEQSFFRKAASDQLLATQVLLAEHKISQRLRNLPASQTKDRSSARLRLLEIFLGAFDGKLEQEDEFEMACDGRQRLSRLLHTFEASQLMELSLSDIAPKVSCSPRHLRRLFRAEAGSSFREKQNALRLARACELLATSEAKITDVALALGFRSSAPFYALFRKNLGVSPGQWRDVNGNQRVKRQEPRQALSV